MSASSGEGGEKVSKENSQDISENWKIVLNVVEEKLFHSPSLYETNWFILFH